MRLESMLRNLSRVRKGVRVLCALAAVLVVVALVLFLRTLTADRDAFSLYGKAEERFSDLSAARVTVRTSLSMAREDRQASVRVLGEVLRRGRVDAARLSADLKLDYFGESFDRKLYYADGLLYRDFTDRRLKQASDHETARAILCMAPLSVPREAVTEASASAAEGGGLRLEMVLDGETVRDLLVERLEELDDMSGLGNAEVAYKSVTLGAETDAGGTLKKRNFMFFADVTAGDATVSLIYEQELLVAETRDVSVEEPQDLGDYKEAPFDDPPPPDAGMIP